MQVLLLGKRFNVGRKKEPVNVLIEKGKKHLTKDEIKKRKDEELVNFSDNIAIPKSLDKKFHKEFLYYVEELKRLDIISNLDVEILEKYLIIKDLHNKCIKALSTGDNFMDKDLVLIQDKYFKQLITLSRELGLTITSRCKLVVPKKDEENKKDSALSILFGGTV